MLFLKREGLSMSGRMRPMVKRAKSTLTRNLPLGMRPIENATILICDGEEDDNIPLYGHGITSDSEGKFEVEWAVAPRGGDMRIVVEKDGYFTVERLFEGARIEWYQFVVIMVPIQ
jgi:hypothetical protein